MNKHKLSWANWSASYINEGTAAFQDGSNKNSLQYTTSGNLVKGYLATNPTSYTACKANVTPESSSSSVITAIPFYASSDRFNASVQNGTLSFTSTASGVANIQVFDMLGNTRVQMSKQLGSGSHSIALGTLPAGSYLVRVQQGANLTQVRFQMR
ncbi:T9SS type A sorting domain-containing protein [Fibrobacter sp.]|uniref:T9SS type A sorting domain-containing protein n=1 Tax=Fibrobacter sp. TaxID=35828 RepID=UPI0025BD4AFE|nr:T9SS type A sorting domain-containing protein [Fibrobacter sp.]MBR4006808.1 T9SS type A sorting domain-containing protein [Fibrobacter sp.]